MQKEISEHTKRKNKELESNEYWVQSREIALSSLQLAFLNNHYLLEKQGRTELDQYKELQSHKITLMPQSMYNYRCRRNKWSVSLMPICFIAKYWNKSIADLLSHDYRAYDEIK